MRMAEMQIASAECKQTLAWRDAVLQHHYINPAHKQR